ncbi:Molybdenum cofactor biosynthesis protein [uncultured Thiomicrorhabdus sp.]|jgi:MOSC domain-containing protein YiiM
MPKLLGIAIHQQSRGAIAQHSIASLNIENGLGDFRGRKNPTTSVTLLSLKSWRTACSEASDLFPLEISWIERRANLLVDDIEFSEQVIGRQLRVGQAVLQITCETDPCARMENLAKGLKAALIPNWRGGARCEVIRSGKIEVGDSVEWL